VTVSPPPIDIVMLWVDGNDPAWRAQKDQYQGEYRQAYKAMGNGLEEALGSTRFNDFGTLRFALRSIEKYVPWYRRIFLITNGQKPAWLVASHPRLIIKAHGEFFKEPSHLPTFNSCAIQANLLYIQELSEHFILLDDDIILTRAQEPSDFFKEGLPAKSLELAALRSEHGLWHTLNRENIQFLRQRYGARIPSLSNLRRAGARSILRKIKYSLMGEPHALYYAGSGHGPVASLKSFNRQVAEELPDRWKNTSSLRFRVKEELNPLLLDQLYIIRKRFFSKAIKTKLVHMQPTSKGIDQKIADAFRDVSATSLCVQDEMIGANPEAIAVLKEEVTRALESGLPEKSSFEK
jgi:hypothetical protein